MRTKSQRAVARDLQPAATDDRRPLRHGGSRVRRGAEHATTDDGQLRDQLLALYDALYAHFGHEPHWWPIVSDTPHVEILVGAVLVQQTRWETVEAAVVRLRDAGLLA